MEKSVNIKIKGQNHADLLNLYERNYLLQICPSKTLNQALSFNFWNAIAAHSLRKPEYLSGKVDCAS
jgi:hypothetical protein